MIDYMIRAIDETGSIRVFVASSTNAVQKAREIHNTSPVSTAAIGRVMTSAFLMGNTIKNKEDKISIQVTGDGLIKNIIAIANSDGEVKAYISNPRADLPLKSKGKLDVGGAIGKGMLTVIKDLGMREPYIGQTELVSGEIAEDLAHYFATSDQQPSAVALGVLVDKDYTVKSAGGYIIQVLPNAEEEVISKLEENIANADPVSTLIDKGYRPEDILEYVCKDLDMKILEKKELKFVCDCCEDRMEAALVSIGEKDLTEIIEEDGQAEICCQFCDTKYQFDKDSLMNILEKAKTK